ncbi:MAG: hypothetical protein ACKVOB_02390 [Sphingomonas sp.]
MIYILLNIYPIAASVLAGLVLGAVYYRVSGQVARTPAPGVIALAVLAEFWLAAILAGALILAPPKADPWVMAVASAAVIWAGFVLPSVAATLAYRAVRPRFILVDCGYWLVVMLVQATVMKLIGLVPPPA